MLQTVEVSAYPGGAEDEEEEGVAGYDGDFVAHGLFCGCRGFSAGGLSVFDESLCMLSLEDSNDASNVFPSRSS